MSAALSGHVINYVVVDPTTKDLGEMVPVTRVIQKYRLDESKGGPGNSGLIFGANTNLGSKWFVTGVDFKNRLIMMPANGRDLKGIRYMPEFKVKSLFRLDEDQP